ncbi:efflux RND transporter periplasmic adaptor subunit [Thalassotalea psychrophila]|uniref:Efflux RND transporter periplasmic adaptor subunit n=1 Tax=Thalassotalea psychrophila TaxID=3065647 RepID=A0ABY9TRT5_9GAMM|nr:efflux RND transporter periplasmic adaptor subunit [Colwelliaceae bacterium SQ149]
MNKFILALASISFFATNLVIAAESEGQLVSIEIAKTEQVQGRVWLPGNVVSRMNATISAEQTGQLLSIVDIGSEVKQGDIIARIDNRDLKLLMAKQEAQSQQYQANVNYLTKQKQRLLKLSETNNTALSELERTEKDLTVAQNEVVAKQMEVKQTQLNITKTEIKAPFSGFISERFAYVGELITVGRPLVALVDPNDLDITVAAPISIAPFLESGAKMQVKWQEQLIELPIRTWSRAGEQSSRTFNVRLAATNLTLLSGTAVSVSLPKQNLSEVLMVPRDALLLRQSDTFVLTVNEDLVAKKVNVTVGQGAGHWVSVSGDITAGDSVIVRGGERLQDGQAVRIDQQTIELAKLN